MEISRLSALFRDYAKKAGLAIDDVYRNVNGIGMQLSKIEMLFNNRAAGLDHPAQVFTELVSLAKTDANSFESILREAKERYGISDIKTDTAKEPDPEMLRQLRKRLNAVAKIYTDPQGLTLDKICALLGKVRDKDLVRRLLDEMPEASLLADDLYVFGSQKKPQPPKPVTQPVVKQEPPIKEPDDFDKKRFIQALCNEAYKKGNRRAGCLVCPRAAERNDYLARVCYPDEYDALTNYIKKDTIGINKKLLGKGIRNFYCMDCLADYLNCTVQDLEDKIAEFKEEGCTLFS